MSDKSIETIVLAVVGLLGTVIGTYFTYLMATLKAKVHESTERVKETGVRQELIAAESDQKRSRIAEDVRAQIDKNTEVSTKAFEEANQLNIWRQEQDKKMEFLYKKLEMLSDCPLAKKE